MPAPTIAVTKLAVHPIKVDLCSGSTVVLYFSEEAVVAVCGDDVSRSHRAEEERRGAKNGDFGGCDGAPMITWERRLLYLYPL